MGKYFLVVADNYYVTKNSVLKLVGDNHCSCPWFTLVFGNWTEPGNEVFTRWGRVAIERSDLRELKNNSEGVV